MIIKRFSEPSTWAGVAAILQALGYFFPQHAMIVHVLTGVAGAVAGALPEAGSK